MVGKTGIAARRDVRIMPAGLFQQACIHGMLYIVVRICKADIFPFGHIHAGVAGRALSPVFTVNDPHAAVPPRPCT